MRTLFPHHLLAVWACTVAVVGCSTAQHRLKPTQSIEARAELKAPNREQIAAVVVPPTRIEQVGFESIQSDQNSIPAVAETEPLDSTNPPDADPIAPVNSLELDSLVATALDQNPRLIRLYREYQAAAARAQYVDKLPDPKLGANIFGNPIETAAGSQRANMSLSVTVPWLARLDAQQRQACLEAMAIRAEYAAERLRVISGVRAGWYRLYVIDKQIEATQANQELLESLIGVANARTATGNASQGDVLLGTLELSKLEERLLADRKQRRAVEAEVNRLVGREAATSIASPEDVPLHVIELDATTIHQFALESQPEIAAARLRIQATCWGIEVARLNRRPELMLSASQFFTDDNRPATPIVNVGEDPWALGVQVSVPLWHEKYDAMRNEAAWKHHASHASIEELSDRYESLILELTAEAQRAVETARLYQATILPQARQTLAADQQSYTNGNVEFDRLIQNYRSLLTLEFGYHQAVGELAIANARIQQAAGRDLATSASSPF
jgi:outer membrane protein TolC